MKRINANEVKLLPNEQEVAKYHEAHMDEGHSVEEAAQLAMLQFWYNYPGAEHNVPNDPFTGSFARYLAYGDERRRTVQQGGSWWCNSTVNLLAFLNRHTGALAALEDAGTMPGYDEAYAEALRIVLNPS